MKLLILVILLTIGCGSSDNNSTPKATPPIQPPLTTITTNQAFIATRFTNGVNIPSSAVATKSSKSLIQGKLLHAALPTNTMTI